MGKSQRSDREFTREQKLVHENKKLKRIISSLRKELCRIDVDRYSQVKEMIEETYQDERFQEGQNILELLKKEWACKEPACTGYLEIITYNKIDTTWYYRKCSECPKRTPSQKYSQDVKGIVKETLFPKK